MSYLVKDRNKLNLLRKIYRYHYENEKFLHIDDNRNVIEVGHWVREILD